MEQFRQISEVLGSIKALMVFRDDIRLNQRQCCLLVDALSLAFDSIAEEMKAHLHFSEKLIKWKSLDHPLKELLRIFRDGEQYIKQCLEPRDWWGKAIALNQNTDCVELYLHDLLWCVPVVIEAIENVGEITGIEQEDILRKRFVFSKKYEREWMEPKLFQLKLGKNYLVSQQLCSRMDTAWKEDRWILSEIIADKRSPGSKPLTKHESRLADLLVSPRGKLFPCSLLTASNDFQVRRRFGSGNNYKEVQWMGETFAVKHVIGDVEPLMSEISLLSSIAHPNVVHYMYSFVDEEKRECYVVMELMSKDIASYIKEISSTRRKVPFSLLVAVDAMLQIARGMEYLHSKNIYHGDLNPSNILVKAKNTSPEGYLHAKVTGFGLSPMKNSKSSAANQAAAAAAANPCIWYAPEVLSEQDRSGEISSSAKCTEKADVYSFSMICFELLTGKIPFEDNHLQGDKMSKNIRAGERPLFSFQPPKYLANLTKRCWQADPSQRPSFSTICRVLRYIKRFLVMNPDHGQLDAPSPLVDYFELDTNLSRRFTCWGRRDAVAKVSEIPFQMFAYRLVERERTSVNVSVKDWNSDSGTDATSLCGDESTFITTLHDDAASVVSATSARSFVHSPVGSPTGYSPRKVNGTANKHSGPGQRSRARPPQLAAFARNHNARRSDHRTQPILMSPRRRATGNASDSELT